MRTLAVSPNNVRTLADSGIVCHDVRNPAQRNEVLVRKGSSVSADDVRALLQRGVEDLHLAIPDVDDVSEGAAAQRLAAAVAGPGVELTRPHFGQVSLRSAGRGLLRVDRAALDRVNELPGALLLTAEPDRPVDAGMTLGVAKCAPLFLP
ncbi:MAG TPA: hypothetical protein VFG86_14290, partial [Chloroflexota bacterium]|nr:hypothetical protein [Chloroflexota bacterium]